ncbi:MAG: fimbrial protein [Plesiomonas shigelloides]
MNFTGTLIIPNCTVTVNSGNAITFGNFEIQNINNVNGAVQSTVALECPYSVGTPYITVTGAELSGSSSGNVLATDKNGLGIALYQGSSVNDSNKLLLGAGANGNGNPITTGLEGINSSTGTFTFTSVLWTADYTKLTPGAFTAAATLSVIYN